MPRLPENVRAKRGRAIPPTWKRMERWVKQFGVSRSSGTRTRELPDETIIYSNKRRKGWPHPWRAALTGTGAVVAPGFVNAQMPRASRDLLTLEGRDAENRLTGLRPEIPLFEAPESGPGGDGRSFLCIRLVVDPETGEAAVDRFPQEWLTVVHRKSLPPGYESGGLPEVIEGGYSVGYFALTVLYWSPTGDRVARLFPAAHHSLQHQWIPGKENEDGTSQPNRHRFFV